MVHFHCFLVNLCQTVLPWGKECVSVDIQIPEVREKMASSLTTQRTQLHSCCCHRCADNIWAPDLTEWNRARGYQKVSRECSEICHSELGSLPSYTASPINLIYSKRKITTSLLIKMLYQLAWPAGEDIGKCCSSHARMFKF